MSAAPAQQDKPVPVSSAPPPIVVDLDGTLILSDLLLESVLGVLRSRPWLLLWLPVWLLQGRAALKRRLAALAPPDPATLPFNQPLLAWLEAERAGGRRIILATASDQALAERVAAHLGLFDMVLGSDGQRNLKGANKAETLVALLPDGFVYAGDSQADLAVWRRSRGAVLVNASADVSRRAAASVAIERSFPAAARGPRVWLRMLRVHQWAKNGLVFAPMLLSHQYGLASAWAACLLGFLAISLVASGTYIINDLLDLPNDRRHPTKRARPIASGAIPPHKAFLVAPLLLGTGSLIGLALGVVPALVLLLYVGLTLTYSLWLKREPILDVTMIAGLFSLRLAYGIVLVAASFSPWLLAFSSFLFFALALAKRHAEMVNVSGRGEERAAGRGYLAADAAITMALGVSAAMCSVMIFILYLVLDALPNSLYRTPEALWAAPLLIFLWVCRIWLLAHRGALNEDPVAFAVKDRTSLAYGALMVLFFLWAALV